MIVKFLENDCLPLLFSVIEFKLNPLGKHGTPQAWYFPLSPTYWGCRRRKKKNMAVLNMAAFSNTSYVLDEDKSKLMKKKRLPMSF